MDTKSAESIEIEASPERVYNLLIDLAHVGAVSPIFSKADWMEGATGPHAGAHFLGYDAAGQGTEGRVLRAMPGEEWAFKANLAAETPETWRYTFERTETGCVLTVKWDAPTPTTQVADSLASLGRLAEG